MLSGLPVIIFLIREKYFRVCTYLVRLEPKEVIIAGTRTTCQTTGDKVVAIYGILRPGLLR